MEYDIRDTIANFVREADANLEQRLEEQAQALREISCINPFYGSWVEMGVEFLFSALELEDSDFAARLPTLSHLSKAARQHFLERMKEHLQTCRRCGLKYQIEADLNARIELACRDNSDSLLQILRVSDPLEADLIET